MGRIDTSRLKIREGDEATLRKSDTDAKIVVDQCARIGGAKCGWTRRGGGEIRHCWETATGKER